MQVSLNNSSHPLWAVAQTGFFILGELLPESIRDVNLVTSLVMATADSMDNPTMISVHLKKLKCNQFGAGVNIVVGHSGHSLCPVAVV